MFLYLQPPTASKAGAFIHLHPLLFPKESSPPPSAEQLHRAPRTAPPASSVRACDLLVAAAAQRGEDHAMIGPPDADRPRASRLERSEPGLTTNGARTGATRTEHVWCSFFSCTSLVGDVFVFVLFWTGWYVIGIRVWKKSRWVIAKEQQSLQDQNQALPKSSSLFFCISQDGFLVCL